MSTISKEEKKSLKRKLREFRKTGLESYAAYLERERKNAEGKDIKQAYYQYVIDELASVHKKLEKLEKKLNKD